MSDKFWTRDRCQELAKLTNDGMSAAMIARELGCTRSAVISKWHRPNAHIMIVLAPEDMAYFDTMAFDAGVSTDKLIASILHDVMTDDMAAEGKP